MAEKNLIPKKRKRSSCSPHPFMGTLTRSRSRIFLHKNRSGRSRLDSLRHRNLHNGLYHFQLLTKKSRRSAAPDSHNIDGFCCNSIKDLRLRRVFSPTSIINKCNLGGETEFAKRSAPAIDEYENPSDDGGIGSCFDEDDIDGRYLDAGKVRENGGIERSFACKDQNVDGESLQTTPPDAEIFADNKHEFSLNEDAQGNHKHMYARTHSNAKTESVISPCFRVRLFKTPCSFSYRRLLPYLTDIAKENSCGQTMVKDLEEKPIGPLFASHSNEISLDESRADSVRKPLDYETTDRLSSIPHPVETTNNNLPLIVENCFSGKSDEIVHCSDIAKLSETEQPNELDMTYPSEALDLNDTKSYAKHEADCDGKVGNPVYDSKDSFLQKPSEGSFHTNSTGVVDKRVVSSTKSKLVLNPCSRLKVFKSPGSFNYRRLLPLLKDIKKDSSCSTGNGHCLKFGKAFEEKALSSSSVTGLEDMPTDNSAPESPIMECHSSTPATSTIADDTVQGEALKTVLSTSNEDLKLVIATGVVDSINGKDLSFISSCSSISSGSLLREESPPLALNQLSVNTEEDCTDSVVKRTNSANPIEADNLPQGQPGLEPVVAPSKGILKRNPRGCRGPCTCLNCSSFRLHAERAFEFSRNQMQDAEDVALDLIEEISCLRNMLEKSASGAENHTVVCINQVKEACRKATAAEELAKSRLNQMNYELNVHCRITCGPRPKVRFADQVKK